MADLFLLTWGLTPLLLGIGFIFRPRLMASLEKVYATRARSVQKRLFKAHRATGLFLVLTGMILLLSFFDPAWFYRFCYMAGYMAGMMFPGLFVSGPTPPSIPTYWI